MLALTWAETLDPTAWKKLQEEDDVSVFDSVVKGIGLGLEAAGTGFGAYTNFQQQKDDAKQAKNQLALQKQQLDLQRQAIAAGAPYPVAAPASSGPGWGTFAAVGVGVIGVGGLVWWLTRGKRS